MGGLAAPPKVRMSPSGLRDFLNCPMLDYYQRVKKLEPVKKPLYFTVGLAFHSAMEVFDADGQCGDALEAADKVFESVPTHRYSSEDFKKLESERLKTEGMIHGYFKKWGPDRIPVVEAITEHEYEWEIGPNLSAFVRFDCLLKLDDGSTMIRERKTSARPTANFFTHSRMDTQVLFQLAAFRHMHNKLPDMLEYDVTVKSALRQTQREDVRDYGARVKEEYVTYGDEKNMFIRQQVVPDLARVKAWEEEMSRVGKLWQTVRAREVWWKNPGNCISGFGTACAWLAACDTGRIDRLLYQKSEFRK